MIIEYIKMKNYRQYVDQKIELGISGNRRFIIIEGGMGTGKTNFLNAITWCLYGIEPHIGKKDRGLPIINIYTLQQMKNEEQKATEVEIMFNFKNRKIRVIRTMFFKKSEDGFPMIMYMGKQEDGSELKIFAEIDGDWKKIYEPGRCVHTMIPKDIHEYFFFDGERLDDYFREEAGNKIRDAVFKISQLELLDRIISHLEKVENEIVILCNKTSPETKDITNKLIGLQNQKDEKEQELKKLIDDKKEAEKNFSEINIELRKSKVENINELVRDRDKKSQHLKSLENELDEFQINYSKYLTKIAPIIMSFDAIIETQNKIAKLKEANEIPPNIKRNYIKYLLDNGCCICGTDISKDNEFRKNVKKLLDDCDAVSDISEELIGLNISLQGLIKESEAYLKQNSDFVKKIKHIENEITITKEEKNKIDEIIKGINVEKIQRLEKDYHHFEEQIAKTNQEIGAKRKELDDLKGEIAALQKQLDDELKKEKKLTTLRYQRQICQDALTIASNIKNKIMEDTRKDIEARTKKHFLEMGWKKKMFNNLTIDNSYNISLKDSSGLEAIGSLSAGERQLLALAFIESLNVISGFNVPIIIDTPLGRIAEDPTMNVAQHLPNYFNEKQVILLVTDKEYSSTVRNKLLKTVCKEYRIKFTETEKGGVAELIPYAE